MRRLVVCLVLLLGIAANAHANPLSKIKTIGVEGLFEKVACNYANDFYCPYGQHRACGYGGCNCIPCGGGRYYGPPRGYYGGPGDNPDWNPYYSTSQNCPRGYTVQDGRCKPYRGP